MHELVQISTVIVFPGRVPPIDRNQCNLPDLAEHHSRTYTGGSVTPVAPMCRQVTQMSIGGVLPPQSAESKRRQASKGEAGATVAQLSRLSKCTQAPVWRRLAFWRRGSPRSQPPRRTAVHWPAHWPPEVVQFPAPRPSVSRPRPSAH